ncbi:hypothetical protein VTN31DRAFT_2415 [Thermomyces dupontii]|uniref:uncharacterized protein n=1 Tax=Talaromyces thermophilus TaxID=28565 RepID=UPI003743AB0D
MQSYPVYVWDLRANQLHEFGSFFDLNLWHADEDENVLVTFEINWDVYPPQVQQTKWSLTDGKHLHQKHFHLLLGGRPVDGNDLRTTRNDWYRTYGNKTVTQIFFRSNSHTTAHLTYDHAVDRLSLRWIDCAEPINDLITGPWGSLAPHIIYRWVPQLRGIAIYNAATGTTTVHPQSLDQEEVTARSMLSSSLRSVWRPISYAQHVGYSFGCFGDHEVLGLNHTRGIELWFFNPDFVPHIPDAGAI